MVKTQNVVFFLGAGFSAPFGLPVMSNFINKARDLYFSDTEKYKTVGKTLELISKYSSIKNYLNVNLHNIEDLLSIAYMESSIGKKTSSLKLITEFIKVVIDHYTDEVTDATYKFAVLIANSYFRQGNTFITEHTKSGNPVDHHELSYDGKTFENTDFGIVSLNYDLVVEQALSYVASDYGRFYELNNKPNAIADYFTTSSSLSDAGIPMAKLHGSLTGSIIPPTWNKNVNREIRSDWVLASNLLSNATHIVFLGYSLPITDNYIKYLFASALRNNQRLKKISVITKDSDGQTGARYKQLFDNQLTVHDTDILNFFEIIGEFDEEPDFDDFDYYFDEFCKSKKQS